MVDFGGEVRVPVWWTSLAVRSDSKVTLAAEVGFAHTELAIVSLAPLEKELLNHIDDQATVALTVKRRAPQHGAEAVDQCHNMYRALHRASGRSEAEALSA